MLNIQLLHKLKNLDKEKQLIISLILSFFAWSMLSLGEKFLFHFHEMDKTGFVKMLIVFYKMLFGMIFPTWIAYYSRSKAVQFFCFLVFIISIGYLSFFALKEIDKYFYFVGFALIFHAFIALLSIPVSKKFFSFSLTSKIYYIFTFVIFSPVLSILYIGLYFFLFMIMSGKNYSFVS